MPRVLILSDIHSNLAALDSVLADAELREGFDEIWALGDSVGYGPQPNECVSRLRETGALSVVGNHELVALGEISLEQFNQHAAAAAEWTMSQLTIDTREYLRGLPRRAEAHGFTLVHGSPRDPVWEYVISPEVAAGNIAHLETEFCAVGHTHIPAAFKIDSVGIASDKTPVTGRMTLGDGHWFVNPGSVGQPRDGDRRAAYALLETESSAIEFHRADYEIERTQKLMASAGLPVMLIERLSHGR